MWQSTHKRYVLHVTVHTQVTCMSWNFWSFKFNSWSWNITLWAQNENVQTYTCNCGLPLNLYCSMSFWGYWMHLSQGYLYQHNSKKGPVYSETVCHLGLSDSSNTHEVPLTSGNLCLWSFSAFASNFVWGIFVLCSMFHTYGFILRVYDYIRSSSRVTKYMDLFLCVVLLLQIFKNSLWGQFR